MKLNLKEFCEDLNQKSSKYNLMMPWLDDNNVFATDGKIAFIGHAIDFPDIKPPQGEVPNILKLLENTEGYKSQPVMVDELIEALEKYPPKKEPIYNREECSECEGEGEIECECSCGDIHEKECPKCNGDGYLRTDKENEIIGEKILQSAVLFKHTHINWIYLSKIKIAMETLKGTWEISTREELEVIIFKNENAIIFIMPMRA